MNARLTKRVPRYLSELHERVYLTLVAHADGSGLVTQCSWTKLMDFAGIGKQSEAQVCIETLKNAQLIRAIESGTRSPHFQILGSFTEDIEAGKAYYASSMMRVNNLQNERTKAYSKTKNGRVGLGNTEISVEEIEEIERVDTKDPQKWGFSVKIPGCGYIRNCVYILYHEKKPFIGGPGKKTRNGWISLIEFEVGVQEQIKIKFEEMLNKRKDISA